MRSVALPAGWAEVPLGEVGKWIGGGTPSKNKPGFWENGTIPWVSPKDMKQSTLHAAEDLITESAVAQSATQIVEPHSVLVVTRSGILRHTLPVATNAVAVALNQDLKAITPHEGFDAQYIAWVLRAYEARILHECSKAGTTVQSVETSKLQSFKVPIAPTREQRRIVAALEEHLSDLDAAVAGLERARAHLKRYEAAVIGRAVSGSVEASADPTLEYQLPPGWQWRSTAECCTKIDSGNTPAADKMHAGAGEVPFIKVYNLTFDGRLDFSVKPTFIDRATHEGKLRRSRLLPGDVLTNIVGPPLGKVAVVPDAYPEWNTNQAVVCFRTGPDLVNRYLSLLFRAGPIINRLSSQARATAGQFNISLTMCRTLRIPVPPVDEQQRILAAVERRLTVCDRAATEIEVQRARAARMRQAILKRAFEGKLVRQDPSDEPATTLMSRSGNVCSATPPRRARGGRVHKSALRGRA